MKFSQRIKSTHLLALLLLLVLVLTLAACAKTAKPTPQPEEEKPVEATATEVPVAAVEENKESEEETEEEIPEEEIVEVIDEPDPLRVMPSCEEGSWVSPVDGARLICIPEGVFMMGSSEEDEMAQDDEKPMHEVDEEDFWIYENEVTNHMFQQFIEATGYITTAEVLGNAYTWTGETWDSVENADWMHPQGENSDLTGLENHPVVNVSQQDASFYCEWANNGDLPSEVEWEKAARGTDQRLYPWGNEAPNEERANYEGSGTIDVTEYEKGISGYGVYNMAGNAAEWISHPYDADFYKTGELAFNFNGETQWVTRGGSFKDSEVEIRTTDRQPISEEIEAADSIGFRCVVPALGGVLESSSEFGDSSCQMVLSPDFATTIITEENSTLLKEYVWEDEENDQEQEQTLYDYWLKFGFQIGFRVDGQSHYHYIFQTPCKQTYAKLAPIKDGKIWGQAIVMIGVYRGSNVALIDNGDLIYFLTAGSELHQKEDGSLVVIIPDAECSSEYDPDGSSAEQQGPIELSGGGVTSFSTTENDDGSIELVFNLATDQYPEGFDAWSQRIAESGAFRDGYSSSRSESNGVTTALSFTLPLPAGSTVELNDDVLTVIINP